MCGFVGCIDLRDTRPADPELLVRMAETIRYRGPDSAGYFTEGSVGLGFRRLAIVDLATGDQPIFSEDRRLVLLCTGEIYNAPELRAELEAKGHVFTTRSDVEVLLHLYEEVGAALLQRLNGQFAFVLFDRQSRQLLLARDPFGITPLYWAITDGFFLFASEVKALLEHPAVPREVDLTGLDQVLSFPGTISPRTIFRGVSSLVCGHRIAVRDGEVSIGPYWDLDYPLADDPVPKRPESHYRERLLELLERAVRYRLQADVPVGLYLSGGLDSALVGALACKHAGRRLHSFSIGFGDPKIDESRYQRLVAEQLGTEHRELRFDWSQIAERLAEMVYHCECPVKESFNTCALALSQAAHEAGIKVILAGEGADELFAGYPGYRFDQLGRRAARSGEVGSDLELALEDEIRERLWGDSRFFYEKEQHAFRELKTSFYSAALNERFEEIDCLGFPPVDKEKLRGRHPVHQRSYLDFKLRLADHLLSEHGDRMVLASSVEGRYPFLDVELVDFAREIPPELKINGFTEKYLVKSIARGLVPQAVIEREKFGFRAPGTPYLLRQGIGWIDEHLSRERVEHWGFFDPDAVEALRGRYLEDGFDFNPHLETDLLMVTLTLSILCERFELRPLR